MKSGLKPGAAGWALLLSLAAPFAPIWSCSGAVEAAPALYRLTVTVASDAAPPATLTVTDQATGAVLASQAMTAFPFSWSMTDTRNHGELRIIEVSAQPTLAATQYMNIDVYYEDLVTNPPPENRRNVGSQYYTNQTGGVQAPATVSLSVAFPAQYGF